MAYRDMDPHQVLIDVIDDVEDAKVRLSLAEAKMKSSGLADRPGYDEVAQFIGAAMRYANVAVNAAVTKRRSEAP
jgi:hypothetical protein